MVHFSKEQHFCPFYLSPLYLSTSSLLFFLLTSTPKRHHLHMHHSQTQLSPASRWWRSLNLSCCNSSFLIFSSIDIFTVTFNSCLSLLFFTKGYNQFAHIYTGRVFLHGSSPRCLFHPHYSRHPIGRRHCRQRGRGGQGGQSRGEHGLV